MVGRRVDAASPADDLAAIDSTLEGNARNAERFEVPCPHDSIPLHVPQKSVDVAGGGPERTPLYKVVAEHLEGWLENREVAEQPVSAHVERDLRSDLTCGILCFGFGRARCTSCGQGFVVAFSCKGRYCGGLAP